ncbi:carbohydrate porin [Acinetobacter bereziniae]
MNKTGYNPTKWLRLRPSLQYIIYPGSSQNVDNNWVFALGAKLNF